MAKSNSTVIAIVGLPGAGKTITADFFRKKNIPVLRFGEITDEKMRIQGLPITQESERTVREQLRQDLGMAAYAIKMEPKIRAAIAKHNPVVIDGLRSWEEYTYLEEKLSHLILLAIYASPKIRYQRLSERKGRHLTITEAHERDIAELNALHMGPPIAIADYLIKNEGSVDQLYKDLETFLEKVTHAGKS